MVVVIVVVVVVMVVVVVVVVIIVVVIVVVVRSGAHIFALKGGNVGVPIDILLQNNRPCSLKKK